MVCKENIKNCAFACTQLDVESQQVFTSFIKLRENVFAKCTAYLLSGNEPQCSKTGAAVMTASQTTLSGVVIIGSLHIFTLLVFLKFLILSLMKMIAIVQSQFFPRHIFCHNQTYCIWFDVGIHQFAHRD